MIPHISRFLKATIKTPRRLISGVKLFWKALNTEPRARLFVVGAIGMIGCSYGALVLTLCLLIAPIKLICWIGGEPMELNPPFGDVLLRGLIVTALGASLVILAEAVETLHQPVPKRDDDPQRGKHDEQ